MDDLIPLAPADAGSLAPAELASVRAFADAEKAASTRRRYSFDWAIFRAWVAQRGCAPLPATPATVAAFLAAEAEAGTKASTIGRRVAAIAYAHKLAGIAEPPTNTELVRATLRGIRRTLGTAPAQKAPATAQLLARMLALCPDTLAGKRDRALLALGFAGAFRRSELVALEVADVTEVPDGLRVTIRAPRPTRKDRATRLPSPAATTCAPADAVQAWLGAGSISAGPLFREVKKGGRVQAVP